MGKIRVTVWNEYRHEKIHKVVSDVYPDGIHMAIADFLKADYEVKTATLDEAEHGLTDEVLAETDVLIWWGTWRIARCRTRSSTASRPAFWPVWV